MGTIRAIALGNLSFRSQNPMNVGSEYRNVRVFVTGAGGFIGSHLVEALVDAGANVRAPVRYTSRGNWGHLEQLAPVVRNSLEVVLGDVRQFLRKHIQSRDAVFHLAALIGRRVATLASLAPHGSAWFFLGELLHV